MDKEKLKQNLYNLLILPTKIPERFGMKPNFTILGIAGIFFVSMFIPLVLGFIIEFTVSILFIIFGKK
jgi:hypothetical protein